MHDNLETEDEMNSVFWQKQGERQFPFLAKQGTSTELNQGW